MRVSGLHDIHSIEVLRLGLETNTEIPHRQLDRQPVDSRHVDAILAEAMTWPAVLGGPSSISVEGARALTLGEGTAAGPKEAFMVDREFCHAHAQGDFSLHASLPLPLATAAERQGWAEPHIFVHTGRAPATIVMLYAPATAPSRTSSRDWSVRPTSSPSISRAPNRNTYDYPAIQGDTVSIIVVGPNDGEPSGGGPIRIRILEDGSHTEHRLGLIEAVVPPSPAGPPQHVHRDHAESFIVTEGKLRFTSGADSVDIEAGSCVTVPAGTPHTFSNPFGEAGKFICTLTPDFYVEYFRDLGKLPVNEQGMLDPADLVRTMAKYATEVIR